jgi:CubicO group peptidase (beta-lactamase class C family)
MGKAVAMSGTSPGRRAATVLGLAGLLGACSSGTTAGPASAPSRAVAGSGAAYPGAEWGRIAPRDAGFDPAKLEKIAAKAGRNGSNCMTVIRHGRLVAEWYWNGTRATTTQEVFSATKSYSSTLVGMAQADGKLSIGDKMARYVPQWAATPSKNVTVRDILSNDSGRHWDATTDYRGLLRAMDRTGFAVGLTQDAAPGTTWVYNNSAIQTLDAVVKKATGQDPADYARARLFGPIGMTRSTMTRDGAGNTDMFFGMQSSCQDMARFGYLFLRDGGWNGTQIVPARWVKEATGRPSQKLNSAYGYLWWLNRRGPVVADPLKASTLRQSAAAPARRLVPSAPGDMYWAVGFGGQIIQVDPGSDTVVVRLGKGAVEAGFGPADTAKVVTDALVDR